MTAVSEALRAVVAECGWEPGTHLENQVALQLSRYRIPLPVEQQYQVGKYRLDFAWPELKIALEADGWWHRSPEGAAKDAERDSWLRSQGWVVLRVDDRSGEEGLRSQVTRAAAVISGFARSGPLRMSDERPSVPRGYVSPGDRL